jgi:hypothetical protein
MNRHIDVTENPVAWRLIHPCFTGVPWHNTRLPFLTERAPLSSVFLL